jgi:hypothetical protein
LPFIRCSRDKRGYESTYVMHVYRPGQGTSRTRVLYLFRSPAHLKVGRQSLDPEVMEALDHTHPDLRFDWQGLVSERDRERGSDRGERHDRYDRPERDARDRRDRQAARPAPPPRPAPSAPPPAPAVVVPDDASLLGRTLGAQQAARLRTRYAEVLQRVHRRARTPEDLDRLRARAERLNPEDWADEASIRSQSQAADAEWNAIMAELPSRRRGRRGGRNRGAGRPMASDGSSAIMTGSDSGESHEDSLDAVPTGPDRLAGVSGDPGGFGPDASDTSDASDDDPSGAEPDV